MSRPEPRHHSDRAPEGAHIEARRPRSAGRTAVAEAASGARAMLPWLAGVAPFGLVIGVSAGQASIGAGAGWFTGPTIYGGSAQIAAIQMLDAGAAAVPVIVTVLVINLRLVLYSAVLARYWRGTPLWWRLLAGYLLVDPSFVVGLERYRAGDTTLHDTSPAGGRPAHAHYLGGAVHLWVGWLVALAVGALAGATVPQGLHLELLVPFYLIGQVVPGMRQAANRRATLVSGTVAAACIAAPLHLGIAIGILAGLVAGSLSPRSRASGAAAATPATSASAGPGPAASAGAARAPVLSRREERL
jgi:predicted branched-subunit amino acid permease